MFDTSVFNFIDRHDLHSGLESFFGNNKDIQVYITPTQVNEINAISDVSKRARILDFSKKSCCVTWSDRT